jgi:uncharacterized protein (DUF433 family)
MSESWSTAQAALILNEPLDRVKKAVQREPIARILSNKGGKFGRRLGWADLIFLHALPEMKDRITPQLRGEIYKGLLNVEWTKQSRPMRITFAQDYHFDFGRHLTEVKAGVKELEQLRKEIDTSEKEPVIHGTQIEAYRIAALVDGMSIEEILADYPSLNERQVLAAKAFADANPKKGRPYPKVTAKKSLSEADLDGLEAFMRPRE